MHLACREGKEEIVSLLLLYGANAFARTKERKTCIHYAVEGGNSDIVQYLHHYGVDIHAVDGVRRCIRCLLSILTEIFI